MRIVIALGGNALGETPQKQKEMARITASLVVPIIKRGHNVILTHGNGPQVGLINLAFSEGGKINEKVYDMPFSECGAMSQGYIGFHLQNALSNELKKEGINAKVTSIITQVEVDKNDPAFLNPTKPIGSFYSLDEIKNLPYEFKEDSGRGYRRVIASPKPIKVIEMDAIKSLNDSGYVVITCGGGGIPVVKENGEYIGIDAVIDKDFASARLASDINSDVLMILTAVDSCKINFNKPNEEKLGVVTVSEMKEYNLQGHFGTGSMKPKVEACCEFVSQGKNRIAYITTIENALLALDGKCGTKIINS